MASEFLCLAKDLRYEKFKDKLIPYNKLELVSENDHPKIITILPGDPYDERDGFYMDVDDAMFLRIFLQNYPEGKIFLRTITRH